MVGSGWVQEAGYIIGSGRVPKFGAAYNSVITDKSDGGVFEVDDFLASLTTERRLNPRRSGSFVATSFLLTERFTLAKIHSIPWLQHGCYSILRNGANPNKLANEANSAFHPFGVFK